MIMISFDFKKSKASKDQNYPLQFNVWFIQQNKVIEVKKCPSPVAIFILEVLNHKWLHSEAYSNKYNKWNHLETQSVMTYTFLLFYSPKPRSQVWILIYRSWSVLLFFWRIRENFSEANSPWGNRTHTKRCFPMGNSHLPNGKMASVATPIVFVIN